MRVCFVATAINIESGGGSHRNIVEMIRALRALGHRVDVHTAFASRNAPPENIATVAHEGEGLSFFAFNRMVSNLLKRNETNYDLFFVYGHTLLWAAGMYRLVGGVPCVVYLDNYLDTMPEAMRSRRSFRNFGHLVWERTIGRKYVAAIDRMIAVSEYLRAVYIRRAFPSEKFSVVPNMFTFAPTAPAEREKSMLYVGRLTEEKGIDLLLEAFARLDPASSWKLKIIGDGPLKSLVEQEAAKNSSIEYSGWLQQEQLQQEYAKAALFVHPARWPEPFGRTIVEAMHASLPVIVPRQWRGSGPCWRMLEFYFKLAMSRL
jgi:glycosyltransferase involved in cell wall biosynthesis